MTLLMSNPWAETDLSAHQRAIQTLHKSAREILRSLDLHPALARDLEAFATTLGAIAEAFAADPAAYRAHRALTAVHLPAFMSILRQSADSEASINQDLRLCMAAMAETENHLKARRSTHVAIEVELLRERLTGTASPKPDAPAKPSVLGALGSKARAALRETGDSAAQILQRGQDNVVMGAKLAGALGSNIAQESIDRVTSPIRSRIAALGETMSQTTFNSIVITGVTAVLFPPLAPLVTGLAILEAPEIYREARSRADGESRKASDERQKARDRILQEAAHLLKGGPRLMRIETDHVIATIDTHTGESRIVILSGAHTGKDFADIDPRTRAVMISKAPDQETAAILTSWEKGKA